MYLDTMPRMSVLLSALVGIILTDNNVYVGPAVFWDPHAVQQICQRCVGRLIMCGEFNAHDTSSSYMKDNVRG